MPYSIEKGYIGIPLDWMADLYNKHPRAVLIGLGFMAASIFATTFIKSEPARENIWETVAKEALAKADLLSACKNTQSTGLPWRRFPMKICAVKAQAGDRCVSVNDDWLPPTEPKKYCSFPNGYEDAKILKLENN